MSKHSIQVAGERRSEPELRKLARALIAIATRQVEEDTEDDNHTELSTVEGVEVDEREAS